MADTVVSSVAIRQSGGGLVKETPLGVDSDKVYHTSLDGNTYNAKDVINWIEDYINSNKMTFIEKKDPASNGVPINNIGIYINLSHSQILPRPS